MFPSSAIQSGTKGRRTAILIALVVSVLSIPVMVYAFGSNPPLGNTGAPGQGTCASCHGTLTAGSGVTVTHPTTYTPGGAAVPMTVSIPSTGGFELAVLTQSGNTQAGTLAPGSGDAVSTEYVYSTLETTSWTFSWTPPATNVGNVVVYVTGGTNVTNYSNSYVLTPAATPDFSLSASPSSVTVAQGASGTSTINVTPTNGFTGTVTLAASGLPTGVTASFSTAHVLTLSASSTAAATTTPVPITITGTSGTLSHTTTVSLSVSAAAQPDFSLSASPTLVAISQGTSGTSTIAVNPLNGFTGTVALTASGLPTGVTASFSTAHVLTLSASSTAAATTTPVPITITGTSGTLSHTTTVSLSVSAVAAPDFSLSASPASLSIADGSSGTSTITITPANGFTGTVALTASGLPTGVTASFSTAHVLTLSASSTAAAGTSTVTVTGTSGSLTHTTTIALSVSAAAAPDFALSASPNSLSIADGSSGTSTITVTPQNGFTGTVALTASGLPTGVTASFSTAHVLTLSASSTAAAGTSSVTVTGTSGSLTHTTTVALTVTSPVGTSSLAVRPSALNFNTSGGGGGGDDASESGGLLTQRLTISSTTGASVYYTDKETTQSGGSWLMLGSSGGTTPGTLVVSVNPRGLASGIYHGTITITPSGATAGPQMVPVTLTVGSPTTSSLSVTPRHLTFSFSGTTDTGSKTVQVTSGTAREFSAAASGGSWLTVSPTSATTPARLTVSVDARGLSTGTYSGMVTLTAGTRKTSVYVTVFVATSGSGGGGDDGSEAESQLAIQPVLTDPTNSGTVGAALLDAAGVPVTSQTASSSSNLSLALSKTTHAPAGTSAGALLVGAENLTKLTELGFDVRQGGHCTANSPHFVVVTSDDVTHVLTGCANGTIQTAPAQGWIRVRFDPANPAQASPPIAPGQSIKSIAIVLDQGPEATPNPGGGLVVLDNIDVNGVIVGKD